MKRKAKEPVKPSTTWWCETCETKEMVTAEMLEHLRDKHGLETNGLKCRRQGIQFLDMEDAFCNTFKVTIASDKGEITLTNVVSGPRTRPIPFG